MTIFSFDRGLAVLTGIAITCLPNAVRANNYAESSAWQFRSSTDRVNQAAILDLIERRRAGGFAAPAQTTVIERQINCSIVASALGNSESQSAEALTAHASGASATAQGNAGSTASDGRAAAEVDNTFVNDGPINAAVRGDTAAAVSGSASQALNSQQNNSGNQAASVASSNGCSFASAL